MTSRPKTPLLDTVNTPDDLRKLGKDQLRQLSDELRAEMIDAVGTTGGHLGSITCSTRRRTSWCGTSATNAIRTRS